MPSDREQDRVCQENRRHRMMQYRDAHRQRLFYTYPILLTIVVLSWMGAVSTMQPVWVAVASASTILTAYTMVKHYQAHTNYRLDRKGYLE